MKLLLGIVVLVVLVLHHDWWLWKDKTLVFGFLPIGLAYHAAYSLLAMFTMWLLVKFAWPREIDEAEAALATSGEGA
jgi:hypothetical protein